MDPPHLITYSLMNYTLFSSLYSFSICGILPAALHSFQSERTFQGIVLITTEAGPLETRSGFFVARGGASARKHRCKPAMGHVPRENAAGFGDGVIKTAF